MREFNELPHCPVEISMEVIGDKWKVLIIRELVRTKVNKLRFCEIKNGINRISDKMLSQNLKSLENDGIISKKIYKSVPVKVEYSLTDLGQTLVPVIQSLYDWGILYKHEVEECKNE